MRSILLFVLMLAVSGCASQRPKNASSYEADLKYAKEAYPFVFLEKKVFDDPLAGVMLRYRDRNNPSDWITIYIYPIPSISWEDEGAVLDHELAAVFKEVDYMIQAGHYRSRETESVSDFDISIDDNEYTGKKAQFHFTDSNEVKYDSYAYLFISKDKFIKFRTSFNAEETPNWSGDEIVRTLLPSIEVPDESPYMSGVRELHKQQMAKQILELLQEAASQSGSSEDK